jgi:hypothetical protein
MIEPSVDYPVLAHRIGNRPEIPSGVAVLERLREMPHLPGNRELSKRIRDRDRLSELCSTHPILGLLGNTKSGTVNRTETGRVYETP